MKRQHEIGAAFEYNGITMVAEAEDLNATEPCLDCFFMNTSACDEQICSKYDREDFLDVVFKLS